MDRSSSACPRSRVELRSVRTVLSSDQNDNPTPNKRSEEFSHRLEVCQPFHASTALTSGIHHLTSMPCNLSVWEKNGKVNITILDPNLIFNFFFTDAQMPAPMQQLFGMFPTVVLNEMTALVNDTLAGLGASERFGMGEIPCACQ